MAPNTVSLPARDSIRANRRVQVLLARLVEGGIIKPDDRASQWYLHPSYKNIFTPVKKEKFPKGLSSLLMAKYGKYAMKLANKSNKKCAFFGIPA